MGLTPREILEHYKFEPRDSVALDAIEKNLKLFCPGNYRVEWHTDQDGSIDIFFDDPEEQTLWLLKWL